MYKYCTVEKEHGFLDQADLYHPETHVHISVLCQFPCFTVLLPPLPQTLLNNFWLFALDLEDFGSAKLNYTCTLHLASIKYC